MSSPRHPAHNRSESSNHLIFVLTILLHICTFLGIFKGAHATCTPLCLAPCSCSAPDLPSHVRVLRHRCFVGDPTWFSGLLELFVRFLTAPEEVLLPNARAINPAGRKRERFGLKGPREGSVKLQSSRTFKSSPFQEGLE